MIVGSQEVSVQWFTLVLCCKTEWVQIKIRPFCVASTCCNLRTCGFLPQSRWIGISNFPLCVNDCFSALWSTRNETRLCLKQQLEMDCRCLLRLPWSSLAMLALQPPCTGHWGLLLHILLFCGPALPYLHWGKQASSHRGQTGWLFSAARWELQWWPKEQV